MPRVVSSAARNIKDRRVSVPSSDAFTTTSMVPTLLKNKNLFSLSSDSKRADLKQYLISLLERCIVLQKKYISVNAPEQVNIPAEFRKKIDKTVLDAADFLKRIFDYLDSFDDSTKLPSMPDNVNDKSIANQSISSISDVEEFCTSLCKVFKDAEAEILLLMGNDSYTRYKKGPLFEKFLQENIFNTTNEYIPCKDHKKDTYSIKDKKSIVNIMNLDFDNSIISFNLVFLS